MKTIRRYSRRAVALTATATLFLANTAFAAPKEGVKSKNMLDQWVIDGGWTMIPLILLLALVIFLLIFNATNLKQEKYCPAELKANLMQLMSECRVRSAIEMAASSPTYLGRLVAYALPNVDAMRPEDLGKDAIEDSIADFTTNERSTMMKYINMLALAGQVAPMLGLFGTVQGMVGAFAILAESGQADPTQLAGSISVALLTTFWGLIIAIIAIPCFFFQKGIANARDAVCVNTLQEMVNTSINVVNAEAQLARIPEGLV